MHSQAIVPSAVQGAAAAKDAETQSKALTAALSALQKAPLSPATQSELNQVTFHIGLDRLQKVLERALDELGAGPRNRVDTDILSVTHGVVVLFRVTKNYNDGSEYQKIIKRFMKSHPGIEVTPSDRPWGNGDMFSIEGTKAARVKFVNDPHWPKLQKAIEDIYMAEHLPGYPASRPKRKIKNATAYVFGT